MTTKIARFQIVGAFLIMLLIAVLVGIPYVIKRRIRSNEAIAIVSLRKITALANANKETHNVGSVCRSDPSNSQNDGFEQAQVRAILEEALKHDYQLEFRNCGEASYKILANPIHSGPVASHTFCSDQTGVIHFAPSPSPCDESNSIWDDRRQ